MAFKMNIVMLFFMLFDMQAELSKVVNEKSELDMTLTTFATTIDQLKAQNLQVVSSHESNIIVQIEFVT
jgi:hypothetical protein